MNVDWTAITAIGSFLGGTAAILGVLAWVWRRLFPINALSERIDGISAHLRKQDSELAVIKHEMFANSGKSMRDRIEQTANDVAELRGAFDALRDTQKGQ